MRRYAGFVSDSARWERFDLRPDDVVISVPSKCGTTWMQTMVGMLIFGSPDLPAPIGLLSPWMDMLTRSEDEVFGILSAQSHRRFIKTHTPLDGLPWSDTVTYLTVIRHPLDVAMSMRDHLQAIDRGRVRELLTEVAGDSSRQANSRRSGHLLTRLLAPAKLGRNARFVPGDPEACRGMCGDEATDSKQERSRRLP
jgi:hypothetical protein